MDYSKWDALADSDDEESGDTRPASQSLHDESQERRRAMQRDVDAWLKRQIYKLQKEGDGPPRARGLPPLTSWRRVTPDERSIIAMLVATSHFGDGETNLERHPEMLDLIRHNRWLETDPGSLELLCRVHHQVMRNEKTERPEDGRMREMLLGGINTLAAPSRCSCPGGLLELITQICTPTDEDSREHRRKWQLKEFAKDALFDSLFPDLRRESEPDEADSSADMWILGFLAVLAFMGVAVLAILYFGAEQDAERHRTRRNSTKLVAAVANSTGLTGVVNETLTSVAAAAAAALAAGQGGAGIAATIDVGASVAAATLVVAAAGECAAADAPCRAAVLAAVGEAAPGDIVGISAVASSPSGGDAILAEL